jgi:hypothetical protein
MLQTPTDHKHHGMPYRSPTTEAGRSPGEVLPFALTPEEKSKLSKSHAMHRLDLERDFQDLANAYKEALRKTLYKVVKDAIPDDKILDQAAIDYIHRTVEKKA